MSTQSSESSGYGFTLAVCAEMIFLEKPIQERISLIHALGFAAEIWDWTTKDLDALAATGARFTSMTGYVAGNLTDPDGADTLAALPRAAHPAAAKLGTPTSTCMAPDSRAAAHRCNLGNLAGPSPVPCGRQP